MDSEVRGIQLKCLEILRIVDDICRRNHIQYSLNGGSVVGAHLYKGCLPWDDDIDILMTRKEYNKFVKIAPSLLPDGYSVENYQTTKEFTVACTKVMDDNTTLVQQDGTISGIFIDITVFDKVPTNFLFKIDVILQKISEIVFIGKVKATSFRKRLRNFMLSTVLSNKTAYFRFFEKVVGWLGHTRTYKYSELFGGGNAQTIRYEPHIFEHYTEIRFEDKDYMIMRDYIDYLVTRYNRTDFREPKEKQVAPHFNYVNFKLPYKEYRKPE